MRFVRLLVIAAGVGLALVVGRDGSLVWVVLRVLAIVACTHLTVVLVGREGRSGPVALIAFGGLACAVGGGITAPYVEEVGWTVDSVVGTATLLIGLALVAVGAVRLVRSYRRWGRLVSLAVVCVTTYFALGIVSVAVTTTNVPRVPVGVETPRDRGMVYEDVRFPATDGVELAGWFLPPSSGDSVVLVSDADTTRSSMLDHAEVVHAWGYGVLLFDPRGEGDSGGRAMALGWDLDRDVEGAVDYVAARPEVGTGRIMVVGVQAGGAAALGAAALPRVCAVVAEGVAGRVLADRVGVATRSGLFGVTRVPIETSRYVLTDLISSASVPPSARAAVTRDGAAPALLIATAREPDEPRLAGFVRDAAPGRVETWVVPGAGSGGAIEARRPEWRTRVQTFFEGARC